MRVRWVSAVAAAAVVVTVLSGCGGVDADRGDAVLPPEENARTDTAAPEVSATESAATELPGSPTLAEIRRRGTLLVGLRADAPDFVRRSEGSYRGFDVRVARLLAEGLGLDPREQLAFRRLPETLRTGALTRGSVDIQLGGVSPSAEGVRVVAPYAVTTGADGERVEHLVAVAAGDEKFRTRLRGILAGAVESGQWRRNAEDTLLRRRPNATAPLLAEETERSEDVGGNGPGDGEG